MNDTIKAANDYESTPTGVMDCLADAVLRIVDMPISDDEKQAAVESLIGMVASRLSIDDLQQIAEDGLRKCEQQRLALEMEVER